jgi:hypothetical protein
MLPADSSAERRKVSITNTPERRLWPRVRVDWGVTLFRAMGIDPINAAVVNISSGGIFFTSGVDLSPGEPLIAHLMIPAHLLGYNPFPIPLTCKLLVLRCDSVEFDQFGIACRMDDYSVQWRCHNGA